MEFDIDVPIGKAGFIAAPFIMIVLETYTILNGG
jgi:hypothetical protein